MERVFNAPQLKRHDIGFRTVGFMVDRMMGRTYQDRITAEITEPRQRELLLGLIDKQVVAGKKNGVQRGDRQNYAILEATYGQLRVLDDLYSTYDVLEGDGRPGGGYGDPTYRRLKIKERQLFDAVGKEGQLLLIKMAKEILAITSDDINASEGSLRNYYYIDSFASNLESAGLHAKLTPEQIHSLTPIVAKMFAKAEQTIENHFSA